jgi:hypothetical protein
MSETNKGKDVTIQVPTMTASAKLLPPQIITYEIHWKKDWLKLTLVALLIIASQWLTSYVIRGCWGMIIGIPIAIGIFFIGIWGITRTVKKTITS